MRQHFVHGDSAIFLNGQLKQLVDDLGIGEFPLLPQDKIDKATLLIVSKPNALKKKRLGLPTAMPLIFTDSRTALAKPNIGSTFDFQLRPAYWLNWTLVFLFVFILAWLGGLRYDSISWMILALASNAIMDIALFSPENTYTPTMGLVAHLAVFSTHAALVCFAWTFSGIKSARAIPLLFYCISFLVYLVFYFWLRDYLPKHFMSTAEIFFQITTYLSVGVIGFYQLKSGAIPWSKKSRFVISFVTLLSVARLIDYFIYQQTFISFVEVLTETGITVFCGFLIYDLVIDHQRYLKEKLEHTETRMVACEAQAIAQTTQMLAHDVRKPFSMLKAALADLRESAMIGSVHSKVDLIAEHVEAELTDVNSMLDDVMEMGRDLPPVCTEKSLVLLIQKSIQQSFSGIDKNKIQFRYNWQHQHMVLVNEGKMKRVFTNIISNAAQAMPAVGTLTFSSQLKNNQEQTRVQVSIHNTGSYIPPEDIEHLFDPFFTKNKPAGTGLGLAIVKKIIESHGGTIDCISHKTKGTTFVLVLPAGESPDTSCEVDLASNSEALIDDRKALPTKITKAKIVVVEDDVFFREMWKAKWGENADVFPSPESFFEACSNPSYLTNKLAIIVDYFFENSRLNGDDVARFLSDRVDLPIFLASNSNPTNDSAKLFDAIIPKEPISEAKLIELINELKS